MKKYLALILALVCMGLVFAGCAEDADASKEPAFQETAVENVSIKISDVSPTGATVVIKDTNAQPYLYGSWYEIEKKDNGNWAEVDTVIEDFAFDLLGYIPDDNGEVKFTIDWKWLYGELPSGNYRLVKQANSQEIFVEFSL